MTGTFAPIYWQQDGKDLYGHDVPDHLAAWERGEFLPNVDPTDTATWQCLLSDLVDGDPQWQNLTWDCERRPDYHPKGQRIAWRLHCSALGTFHGGRRVLRHTFISTPDPALALVQARIRLERTDR